MSASTVDAGSSLRLHPLRPSTHQYDRRLVRRLPGRAKTPTLARALDVLGGCCAVTACRVGMLMGRRPYAVPSTARGARANVPGTF
jgi:hypothetical protein